MSVAEAGRQWIASIRGEVRETTWRGYEASIARLGDYLATHEGASSLGDGSLSAVSRRIAGEVKRAYEPAELVKLLRAAPDMLAPKGGGYGLAMWDPIRLGLLTGAGHMIPGWSVAGCS